MEDFPKIEQEPPLGRKQMVDALKDLSAAADVILGGLTGQPMKFGHGAEVSPFRPDLAYRSAVGPQTPMP